MCEKNNAHALGWISLHSRLCFWSCRFWFTESLFSVFCLALFIPASLGNIAFVVLCLSMLAGIAGLAVPVSKPTFSFSVVLTGLIYVTDGVMFYVSKLKNR